MTIYRSILVFTFILLFSSSSFATDSRTLKITADSKIKTVPDQTIIQFAIEAEDKTPHEAFWKANKMLDDIINSINSAGTYIGMVQFNTKGATLVPIYAPSCFLHIFCFDDIESNHITGYRFYYHNEVAVSQSFRAVDILTLLKSNKSIYIYGLYYEVSPLDGYIVALRERAIEKAKSIAKQYEQRMNITIGIPLSIKEHVSISHDKLQHMPSMAVMKKGRVGSDSTSSVLPDEVEIVVTVAIDFEILADHSCNIEGEIDD